MKQDVKKTKRGGIRTAKQPPTTSISAALMNARYADPMNNSIPSSLRNFEAGILDAPVSGASSTEAIVAEDQGRPVLRMTRLPIDTAYPAVRGHRGRSPSPHAEPGAQKRSSDKFWLHVGVAIFLTASVACILNMMLETADSEESEPPNRMQPKQAASSASANHSGISNSNGTTADNTETTTPTSSNEVTGNPQTMTVLYRPEGNSGGAVDNASSGGINTEQNPGNASAGLDEWAIEEVLGMTSQGLVRGEVRSDTDAPGEMWNRSVLSSSMTTDPYSNQTKLKVDGESNSDSHNKLSSAQRITQGTHKSTQHIDAKKMVGISLAFPKSVTAQRRGRGNQDGVRHLSLPPIEGSR